MKSIQPNLTVFLFHVALALWFIMAATLPTILPSWYARKYSASQNSNAGFLSLLKVFMMSEYKSGTEYGLSL